MQPSTYTSVALIFFSWLTIAWTGTLVETVVGGLLGGSSGTVIGGLFGSGGAGTAFVGWLVLGVVVTALIKIVCSLELTVPLFMIVVTSGIGTIMAGSIVANLGHFYRHHSRTKFQFGVIQGAGLGGAIAGVIGTGYWAVISAAILNASQRVIKNFVNEGFGVHSAILLLLLTAISGMSVGILFKMTQFFNLSAIYFVALVDFTLILIIIYSPKK